MSRQRPRRDPRDDEFGLRRKVQLYCTDRGQHEETHLAWCDVSRAEERPSDMNEAAGDWLFLDIYKDGAPSGGAEDWARQSIDLTTGDVYRGDDRTDALLENIRQRYTPTRLCDRCRKDVPLSEARLATIVRHAQDTGLFRLDASRLG